MHKKFYSCHWFLKNQIFSLFPIVKLNANYAEICRVGNVESDYQQVPLVHFYSLRKHVYSNILKFLPPKNEYFQMKNSDIFHISAQNIDCGYSLEPPRRGGSNEYPQSMFSRRF